MPFIILLSEGGGRPVTWAAAALGECWQEDRGYDTSETEPLQLHFSPAQHTEHSHSFGSAGAGDKIPGESYSKSSGYIMKRKISWQSGFFGASLVTVSKESACNAGDPGLTPGSGRSPGEGNGNPLQYSGLKNPMDRRARWATFHDVAKSRTWLRD